MAASRNPLATAEYFEHVWCASVQAGADGIVRVVLGDVHLGLMSRPTAAARYGKACIDGSPDDDVAYLGFRIQVASIRTLRECLDDAGFPVAGSTAGAVWLAPSQAHGCLVEFQEDTGFSEGAR